MNNTDYLVVMGGGDNVKQFSDIIFFNFATRSWETYPTKIRLPVPMADIRAMVALQLGVHFIDILRAARLYKIVLCCFSLLTG